MRNEKGQTLILTLIVTVISLVIGVAISSRAVSTLKQTSYTAQAGKAQKAADAGAEEALGVADLSTWLGTHTVDFGDGTTAEYTVAQEGGGSSPIRLIAEKDSTKQLNLTNTSLKTVRVSWNGSATIVYSVIHKNGAGTVTLQQKGASDPDESDACGLTGGVSNPVPSSPGVGAGSYEHSIDAAGLSVGAGEELHLRVRPLCADDEIQIEGLDAGGAPVPLPTQGYKITSTGTYGDAQWTVEVTKMNPALPAIFDFAIFSESDLTK